MKLIPRAVAPEIAFQLTEGCPAGQPPNWCLASPSQGRVQILTDAEVRLHFDIEAEQPSYSTWTAARRTRGALAFLSVDIMTSRYLCRRPLWSRWLRSSVPGHGPQQRSPRNALI
jgi:hypothetical protein